MSSKSLPDDDTAYRTLLLPQDQNSSDRRSLLLRGFAQYVDDDGTEHGDELLADIERFGLAAIQFGRIEDHDDVFTHDPGRLALLATLSSLCLKNHDRFKEQVEAGNADKIKPLHDVRDYYLHNIVQILHGRNDLLQEAAESIFAQPRSDVFPHPGRACTGIEYRDDLGTYCFAISVLAASSDCIIRDEDGDPRVAFEDRTLYIPLDALETKYDDYLETGYRKLVGALEDLLSHDRREWIIANESRLSEKIEADVEANRFDEIWMDWDIRERKIRVIKNAVKESDDITVGEPHTASELYDAIDDYKREGESWESGWLSDYNNSQSVAQTLRKHTDHRDVEVVEQGGTKERHKYIIHDADRGATPVDASHPSDLFQLPCFENMRKHLHEEGPTRRDLWNFVRTAWWLTSYHSSRPGDKTLGEDFLEDIHETFEAEWDWYDRETTGYQVRYEIEQGDIEGNIPRPENCDHEHMQTYCIGKDTCKFSIYGSLPFPEEMYEFLDDEQPV
jgi:hypothetical protein